jgi:putative Mn2+ efflux pump MntP
MDTLEFLLLGIVIALNNLAFSFSMGALGTRRYHLRIVLVFALVEFTVPLAGLFVGRFYAVISKNTRKLPVV